MLEQGEYSFLDRQAASNLLEKYKKLSYIKNLDFSSDDSIQKYVDPENPFTDLGYIPEDMTSLEKDFIVDTK